MIIILVLSSLSKLFLNQVKSFYLSVLIKKINVIINVNQVVEFHFMLFFQPLYMYDIKSVKSR